MRYIIETPIFAVLISLLAYELGILINKKTKIPLFNPLMIAIATVMLVLVILKIPLEKYQSGGNLISFFLTPATVILAVPLYKNIAALKKDWVAIISGVLVGSVTAIASVYLLGRAFLLSPELLASLIPKSITTPFGIELSQQIGGIPSVTVAAIIITGITGAVFAPIVLKIFKIRDATSQGIAIGTSAHALGTTKAVELGETQGAMSGLAIGLTGIATVIIATILFELGVI